MFDPTAPLALLNLLLAFLFRPNQPRCWRALARMQQVLADLLRATLREAGMAVPDLSNAELIKWFTKNGPCSDQTGSGSPSIRKRRNLWSAGVPAGILRLNRWNASVPKTGVLVDRRLQAVSKSAGKMSTVHAARAPP
jgi:hypothetical protein